MGSYCSKSKIKNETIVKNLSQKIYYNCHGCLKRGVLYIDYSNNSKIIIGIIERKESIINYINSNYLVDSGLIMDDLYIGAFDFTLVCIFSVDDNLPIYSS